MAKFRVSGYVKCYFSLVVESSSEDAAEKAIYGMPSTTVVDAAVKAGQMSSRVEVHESVEMEDEDDDEDDRVRAEPEPYVADCYVVLGEKVLVLFGLWDPYAPTMLAEMGTKRIPMAPSFEVVGEGRGADQLSVEEVEELGRVWFSGRPDCTGPTYMARAQAESWVKVLKRGEIRHRTAS